MRSRRAQFSTGVISKRAVPKAPASKGFIGFLPALMLLVLSAGVASAQMTNTTSTDGTTPLGLSPGAPAGAYALSDFDNLNLYNGSLNFVLPLLKVGGRGSAQMALVLGIEQHWRVRRIKNQPNCETCMLNVRSSL